MEETWGKVSLAEGTACTKTLKHEMASDGVSGAHGSHKGRELILLVWRMWSLDCCGEVPDTVKNGQEGRKQGDQVTGCYGGPARGRRGSGIDGEDRPGFTLMCIKVVVDICLVH